MPYTMELVMTQIRHNFYFTGVSTVEDLGNDRVKLERKANELNKIDGEWGIHHWIRVR